MHFFPFLSLESFHDSSIFSWDPLRGFDPQVGISFKKKHLKILFLLTSSGLSSHLAGVMYCDITVGCGYK